MSDIILHIDRLVVEGIDLSSRDAEALRAALTMEVERRLGLGPATPADVRPSRRPSGAALSTLRTADVVMRGDGAALGRTAAGALAAAIQPLCAGGSKHGDLGGRGRG